MAAFCGGFSRDAAGQGIALQRPTLGQGQVEVGAPGGHRIRAGQGQVDGGSHRLCFGADGEAVLNQADGDTGDFRRCQTGHAEAQAEGQTEGQRQKQRKQAMFFHIAFLPPLPGKSGAHKGVQDGQNVADVHVAVPVHVGQEQMQGVKGAGGDIGVQDVQDGSAFRAEVSSSSPA